MLQLKVVKPADDMELKEEDRQVFESWNQITFGSCQPWRNSNRIVCADIFYASVQVARDW
jgi:hypothetical protein